MIEAKKIEMERSFVERAKTSDLVDILERAVTEYALADNETSKQVWTRRIVFTKAELMMRIEMMEKGE